MEGYIFELLEQYDYENLIFIQEKSVGLKAVIAIHSTRLGPAAGGTRMYPYASEADAIKDAMRLARAMTYKWAGVGANCGGGKCVIIGDPKRDKTEALLRALGGPGDTAPPTALGVIYGIRACLNAIYGSPDPKGRSVAVQGVGAVGKDVVAHLVKAGAIVAIADVDQEKVERVAAEYPVNIVAPGEIITLPVDVFCPCALGSILNDQSIPALRCKIVCGSANNQLADEKRHGEMIAQRDILYAPDFIVNAGGALSGIEGIKPGGYDRQRVEKEIAHIYDTMEKLITISQEQQIPTYRAADLLAEQRLAQATREKI